MSGGAPHRPWRAIWRSVFTRRMLVSALMGFACGVPLLLTLSLLQAWMKAEGVDLGIIGLFALVQLPYTVKFLWAPLFDRFTLPFLGRRRGWLLVTQLLLMGAIFGLGQTSPAAAPWSVAAMALVLTFLSASQDSIVDAYRREDLADDELGLGASLYVGGYRLGTLVASGGGLILSDHMPFSMVYAVMAACLIVGVITTLLTPEPAVPPGTPQTLRAAVIEPFIDFFRRRQGSVWVPVLILLFLLLYKLGDQMASASMTIPFFLDLGFSRSEIGAIYKIFGTWMIIAGSVLGGVLILRLGTYRSLWIFGILQMASTAGFAALALIGQSLPALTVAIMVENLCAGLGTAALLGFMAKLTDRRFTATQYALLSSLTAVSRSLFAAPTGYMAEALGWFWFFIVCTLIAIPGLLLLPFFASWAVDRPEDAEAVPA